MDLKCELNEDYGFRCGYIRDATILQLCQLRRINGKPADEFNDLRFVDYEGSMVHYLPSGMHKFFPQLTYLNINNCGIKEITSNDLFGLENLNRFDVLGNDLKSLPDDLFIHTKKLEWIEFENNKLEFLSSHLFDPLPENQLVWADFRGNTKIDAIYVSVSLTFSGARITFGQLKALIDSSCSAPIPTSTRNCSQQSTSAAFRKLWDHKDFSDFTIIVRSKEFSVHKCVLAAQSSVFASMLKNDEQVKATNKLEIKDCSEEVVPEFLKSLYTGEVENAKSALELFTLASTFDVEGIKIACENAAVEQLTEDNAMDALKVGNLYKSEKIIEAAFRKIQKMLPDKLDVKLKRNPEKIEAILKNFTTYKESLND